jgi:hypothetical protein
LTHHAKYIVEMDGLTVVLALTPTVSLPLAVNGNVKELQLGLFWNYVAQRLQISCSLYITVSNNNATAKQQPSQAANNNGSANQDPSQAANDTGATKQDVSQAVAAASAILSLLVAIPNNWQQYALECKLIDLQRFMSARPKQQNLQRLHTFWPPALDRTQTTALSRSSHLQGTVGLAELTQQIAADQLSRGLAFFPTVDCTGKNNDQAALVEILYRPDPLRSSEHVLLRYVNPNAALANSALVSDIKAFLKQLRQGLPAGDIYCIIDMDLEGHSYQFALALAFCQALGWLSPCATDAIPFATGQFLPPYLSDKEQKNYLASLRANSPMLQVFPVNELPRKWAVFSHYQQHFPQVYFYMSSDQTGLDFQSTQVVKIRALQEHLLGEIFRSTYLSLPVPH